MIDPADFHLDISDLTSIDMPTALHPQTQLTFWFDGQVLPRKYSFPMKLRIPTKLGFKNPKHIGEIEIGMNSMAAIGRPMAIIGSAGFDGT